jgi:Tol biopolymer transport system component
LPLATGTRLGPYEIASPLGAGGMGEVYRARDTRLDRDVALKVLPAHLAADPDWRARFEREARAVAALNHPHICTLHDIGRERPVAPGPSEPGAAPIDFLVMEHLGGETLALRLERGPLPREESLHYAVQIADALHKAHRLGVVHRDLKPGNVMVAKGHATLLDFGLATFATERNAGPAVTRTTPLTAQGTILGTLQYMSPEQLEGHPADARSDIFAFGCVLFEMLTGQRAFDGASQASVIGAILRDPPPQAALDRLAPAALARIVRSCLEKDPDRRWQSAGDLARELAWIAAGGADQGSGGRTTPPPARHRMGLSIGLGLLALAGWGAASWLASRPSAPAPEVRLSLLPPPALSFVGGQGEVDPHFALAPDGRALVFAVSTPGGGRQLWLRMFDSLAPKPITGTEGGDHPAWSPDGESIAFIADNRVKKVPVTGGPPRTLGQADRSTRLAWGRGEILVDRPRRGGVPVNALAVVPEDGGAERHVIAGEAEVVPRWPSFLADGRRFIYLAWHRDPAKRVVMLASLDAPERVELVRSPFKAEYVLPGHLVYVRDGTLVAQRLELNPPRLVGEPRLLVDNLGLAEVPGQAQFAVSRSGVVGYRTRSYLIESDLIWLDRAGRQLEQVGSTGAYISMALSPDGTRLALTQQAETTVENEEPASVIWLRDLVRGVNTRFTVEPVRSDENPLWTPDGRAIVYASHPTRGSLAAVHLQAPGRAGTPASLVSGLGNLHPIDISRDGRRLLLHHFSGSLGNINLWWVELPAGKPQPLVESGSNVAQGQFSPDGRWVAYSSDESGQMEVYLRRFPSGDERWQLSAAGGSQPRWRPDGRELFYVAPGGALMAVAIATEPDLKVSSPVELFRSAFPSPDLFFYGGTAGYVVGPDGTRFLVNRIRREAGSGPIHLVMNWRR